MAKVLVDYVCGCGYKTRSREEAEGHSDAKHHQINVTGTIRPDNDVRPVHGPQSMSHTPLRQKEYTAESEFDALRHRLKRQ